MKEQTHIRVKHCIQNVETRQIEHFASANKAKRHSRESFAHGELRKADKLLAAKDKMG